MNPREHPDVDAAPSAPVRKTRMKILLPEGSSMSARDIVFALGREHTIDVLDPSPVCQLRFSSLVRRWYRCPSYSREPQAYLAYLLQRLRAETYDVLLPTHEQTYLLSRFHDQIRPYVGLAVPEFEAVEQLQSKAAFARLLERLEIPAPPTRIVSSREALEQHAEFPCFMKVDFSTAGNGVRPVRDAAELRSVADDFEAAGFFAGNNEILIQQAAIGFQCTALAIFDSGRMLACLPFQIRKPGVGGWGMNGESIDHPDVLRHVRQIGGHLGFHGALFVDYFYDPARQQPQYIEANPRFGAAYFPRLCGLEFGQTLLDLSLGRSVQPLGDPKFGIRYHQGFLMLISAAKSGANRRELLRELWDAFRRQGFYTNSTDTITDVRQDPLSLIPALAVTLLLLASPQMSHWLVRRTLENYTLPTSGVRAIRAMRLEPGSPPRSVPHPPRSAAAKGHR